MSLRIDATDMCHGAYGGRLRYTPPLLDVDNNVQFEGRSFGPVRITAMSSITGLILNRLP